MQDLWQFPDRQNWYKAKFVADDAPDFQPATLIASRQATAQVREITLDIEMSRERIPLRNAYRHIGQLARVRLASGLDYDVPGEMLIQLALCVCYWNRASGATLVSFCVVLTLKHCSPC